MNRIDLHFLKNLCHVNIQVLFIWSWLNLLIRLLPWNDELNECTVFLKCHSYGSCSVGLCRQKAQLPRYGNMDLVVWLMTCVHWRLPNFCTRITWMRIKSFIHAVLSDFPNYIGLIQIISHVAGLWCSKKCIYHFTASPFSMKIYWPIQKLASLPRRFSWELASNLENVKRNIKYYKIIGGMNAGDKRRSCGEKVVTLLGSLLIFEDRKKWTRGLGLRMS